MNLSEFVNSISDTKKVMKSRLTKATFIAKNIEDLKGKLGVFWHTQGSGKSYSMVFICQKILNCWGFIILLKNL